MFSLKTQFWKTSVFWILTSQMKYLWQNAGDICSLFSLHSSRGQILTVSSVLNPHNCYKIVSLHFKQTMLTKCYPTFRYHCFLWYQHDPILKWYLTLQSLQFFFLVQKSLVQIQGTLWVQLVLLMLFLAQRRVKNKWTDLSSEISGQLHYQVNSQPCKKSTASRWPRLNISSQPEKKI